jgi:hypothetical protein
VTVWHDPSQRPTCGECWARSRWVVSVEIVAYHGYPVTNDTNSAGTPRNNEKVTDVTSFQDIIWCDKAVGGPRSPRTARYLGLVSSSNSEHGARTHGRMYGTQARRCDDPLRPHLMKNPYRSLVLAYLPRCDPRGHPTLTFPKQCHEREYTYKKVPDALRSSGASMFIQERVLDEFFPFLRVFF